MSPFLAFFRMWRVWFIQGNQDIRLRYKRSILGPFWISASLASLIIGLAFLYSEIFQQDVRSYAVFLAGGLIAWNFINATIAEGATMVIDYASDMRGARMPLSVLAGRVAYRNMTILGHNMVVGIATVYLCGFTLTPRFFLIIPGLIVLWVFAMAAGIALAPICARYRDLPEIVRNFLQLMFFLTPIFWLPSQAGRRTLFVEGNPFNALIDLVRAPLINSDYSNGFVTTLSITMAVTIALAIFSYLSTRRKLYNWL